jgi:hypothetical protein
MCITKRMLVTYAGNIACGACSVLLSGSCTHCCKDQTCVGARERVLQHSHRQKHPVCMHFATCAPAKHCKTPCEQPRQRAGRRPSSTGPPGTRCTACSRSAPAPARSPPQSCRSPRGSSRRPACRACGPRACAQPLSRSAAAAPHRAAPHRAPPQRARTAPSPGRAAATARQTARARAPARRAAGRRPGPRPPVQRARSGARRSHHLLAGTGCPDMVGGGTLGEAPCVLRPSHCRPSATCERRTPLHSTPFSRHL